MRRDLIAAVDEYLRDCFYVGTAPRVDELAYQLSVHPAYLSRLFRAQTGYGLSKFLKQRQIREAKRLLSTTDMTLNEIVRRSGFGTPNTFFRCFKHATGTTPMVYRRAHRVRF